MSGIVLSVTIFWGLLLVILGVITMVATIGTDGSDSLFYAAMGVTLSGGFIAINGVIIAILDTIFKSSAGVG